MGNAVYVASAQGYTGKSAVALGVLEQLSRRVGRVGIFRPVVRADAREDHGGDYVLDLLVSHDAVTLSYDDCAGVTYDEVHADPTAAMATILERYHRVAERCDAVVVVGSDYTDVGTPTEFSFNARIAANLGIPVLLVVNAAGLQVDELRTLAVMTAEELRAQHATLLGVVANRVDGDLETAVRAVAVGDALAFALPEEPLLSTPSMAELLVASGGQMVSGDESLLLNEVTGIVVGAMTMPHVLDRLFDGAAVVTPGDRPEVVMGVLMAHVSAGFPRISGIILNGGLELPDQVTRLIEGLGATMPIIATDLDTHAAVVGPQRCTWPADPGVLPQDRHRAVAVRRARRRRGSAGPVGTGAERRRDATDVRVPADRPGLLRRPTAHRAPRRRGRAGAAGGRGAGTPRRRPT